MKKHHCHHHESHGIHVALVFKDFAAWLRTSCVGLNVAGYTTAKFLEENGVDVTVFPVRHNIDLVNAIDKYHQTHDHRLTHVIISAPWLSAYDVKNLIENFSDIKFVILSHSNVGFLQADPWGVELLRKYIELSMTHSNISVGGNSSRFTHWLSIAYGGDAVLLPNLYPIDEFVRMKPIWDGHSPLKIGAFGAARPEKNLMTAAAAAILIQRKLGVDVELHMSSGGENDKNNVTNAIEQMYKDLDGNTLVQHNWSYWDVFIKLISQMDLLLQPSYTESFNMVTADGISVGVPTVVSSAIHWAPRKWMAEVDSPEDIAEVGITLLTNRRRRNLGIDALMDHNKRSLALWMGYLELE